MNENPGFGAIGAHLPHHLHHLPLCPSHVLRNCLRVESKSGVRKKKIVIATHTKQPSNSRIRRLAVEQSRILERLIVANSRLQQEIYRVLTAEQRRKLNGIGQETDEVTTRLFSQQ
jgi:hypothetical protein